MQKIIIFGTGELAQRIFYYLRDSEDKVVAFSANKSNISSEELLGLPVIPVSYTHLTLPTILLV